MTQLSGRYTSAFYERQAPGSFRTARRVAPLVYELLAPASIVDVGCGVGTWLAAFRELGVTDILGIDGPHVDRDRLLVPSAAFTVQDLRGPLSFGRTFDLAISLEVAEHLPPAGAADFVRTLTALSVAVLFSAAIPLQGGEGHVNEQWQDYWAELFAGEGYEPFDCVRPAIWTDSSVDYFYAQNTILYLHREVLNRRPDLAAMSAQSLPALRVVHPEMYMAWAMRVPTLGATFRRLVPALRESVVHRARTFRHRGQP